MDRDYCLICGCALGPIRINDPMAHTSMCVCKHPVLQPTVNLASLKPLKKDFDMQFCNICNGAIDKATAYYYPRCTCGESSPFDYFCYGFMTLVGLELLAFTAYFWEVLW